MAAAAAEATAEIIVLVEGTWRFWVWGNMVFGGKDWIFEGFWEMGFISFGGFVAENSDWGRNVAMVVVGIGF